MKKLTTLLLVTLLSLTASSATLIDGIYYDLNITTKQAEVTLRDFRYTGAVNIPEKVTYDDVIYNVTSIGNGAFRGCTGLTSIEIPNSVTTIGEEAFAGCSNLTSVTINSDAIVSKEYQENSPISAIFGSQVKEYIIGEGVTSIGHRIFSGCSNLTSVTIPSSVTSIGNWAFGNCSGLTSVTIPNRVTSIGSCAFYYCYGLTEVTIPNNVISIRSYAFTGCSGLTSVTIPSSVTSIGEEAFNDCSSLTEVTINSDAIVSKEYQENSPISAIFGSQVKEYIIGEGVTSIGHRIFSGCSNLTSVTIPSSVTSIGNWAFGNCSGLTSVTIPNRVTSIGSCAFYYCYGLTEVTIPNNVISIRSYAFTGCSGLTSVTIPSSVTSIGEEAFNDCSSLTEVTINSDAIVSKEYQENSPISAIFGSQVKEYIIGEGVTSIGHRTFTGCSDLTSVTIPSSVTSIGNRAFYGCSGLTSVTIPNSVTNIGISAFFHCDGLKKVTIGNSVTAIGNYAFYECFSLTSITCKATSVPSTGNNAFDYIPLSSATLYVPEASVAAYKATAPWSGFGSIVELDEPVVGGIAINETNFPDENFRSWLKSQSYGSDGMLTEEEIASVTEIDVSYKSIKSLQGIEFFTALTWMDCNNNQLTALDVSKNTALTTLYCYANQLTALDVSGCTGLTEVTCYRNQLTSLDVSECMALTQLSCFYNQLTALDVSKNTALIGLACGGNQLTSLDVSGCTALTQLDCGVNQLTALDVSKNTALIHLFCGKNQLTALDVSKNTALKILYCDGNQLTALDVSKNTALTELSCYYNQLTTLDVSANTALRSLNCSSNQLTSLDVSKNTALTWIVCSSNQIKGAAMDAFVESLSTVRSGSLYVIAKENEQNVMTTTQVAAAKAKGWIAYLGDDFEGWGEYQGPKCATPTIAFVDGKLQLDCDTEDAVIVSKVTCADAGEYEGTLIPFATTYNITTYAKKDGYIDSDVATKEINVGGTGGGVRGDVNQDGEVNVGDMVVISNIMSGNE